MHALSITAYTATSALGSGLEATLRRLQAGGTALASARFETSDLPTWVGEVPGIDEHALPAAVARFDCRNNRLADLALARDGFEDAVARAVARHGPRRVGLYLGTSTSGILSVEVAYRHRDPASGALPSSFSYRGTQNAHSLTEFLRERLGVDGPGVTHSSACSSSAKVFASAARAIRAGLVDAAIVGGVDSLCLTTIYGFQSLDLLSADPCRPWDAHRNGISIGEAAAYFLLEREGPAEAPCLLGFGESSDAWHMSSPHPEGEGARASMNGALARAGLRAADVDYVNLHGTGTPANDAAEDKAMVAVFGERTPCSSTKGMTGHALGAAGALETAISLLALRAQFVPGSGGTREVDPALRANYVLAPQARPLRRVMTNSFGFGGSNCSLVLGLRGAAP